MGGFYHIEREIIVRHNGTADRGDSDSLALDAELVNNLGDKAVNDTVGTAGAIVQRHINQGFRSVKYYHYLSPPSFAFLIASSTSAGDGIIPPTRLQSVTGLVQRIASSTSSIS